MHSTPYTFWICLYQLENKLGICLPCEGKCPLEQLVGQLIYHSSVFYNLHRTLIYVVAANALYVYMFTTIYYAVVFVYVKH